MFDDADPSGSLVLKAGHGEGQISIRVASKVLTLASPVFAAMLSSRYAEGQDAGENNRTVSLPEDDPEAMSLVCAILHYQLRDTAEVLYTIFGKVAELYEEYDLVRCLRGWAELVLQGKKSGAPTKKDCESLLRVSCVFGSREVFWISSWKLLKDSWRAKKETVSHKEPLEMNCATLPDGLLAAIDAHRDAIVQSIRRQLEAIIEPDLQGRSSECTVTVADYFRELKRVGLWPMPDIAAGASLKHIIDKLEQSEDRAYTDCFCHTIDIPRQLRKIAEAAEKRVRGLCLRCVREGRLLPIEGNCMAFFSVDCSTPRAHLSVPAGFLPEAR